MSRFSAYWACHSLPLVLFYFLFLLLLFLVMTLILNAAVSKIQQSFLACSTAFSYCFLHTSFLHIIQRNQTLANLFWGITWKQCLLHTCIKLRVISSSVQLQLESNISQSSVQSFLLSGDHMWSPKKFSINILHYTNLIQFCQRIPPLRGTFSMGR